MKPQQWRPSAALKKRRGKHLAFVDVTGVAAIFFFLVFMYIGPIQPDIHRSAPVDMPIVAHASPQLNALREDAIVIAVSRDGMLYFQDSRIRPTDVPDRIRDSLKEGSERKVYLKADARATYGDVQAAVDLIRQAGIKNVVLLVESPRHSPSN